MKVQIRFYENGQTVTREYDRMDVCTLRARSDYQTKSETCKSENGEYILYELNNLGCQIACQTTDSFENAYFEDVENVINDFFGFSRKKTGE